jgi:glutamate mutase epsilon subunit
MKKIAFYVITAIMLLSITTTPASASHEMNKVALANEKIESAEAKAMMSRLEEIKAMDKSNMTSKEKRELRKEVRSIKKSMSELSGGVYLSVGAIIIIVLLLILLL